MVMSSLGRISQVLVVVLTVASGEISPAFSVPVKAVPLPKVVINEVDCDGNDWIEIFNRSKKAIDLSSYRLTDRIPSRAVATHLYAFPRGTVIKAKSRKVVQQVGAGKLLPFGLPCTGGETLRLVKVQANGTYKLIDSIAVPAIANGYSYGRKTDGSRTWTRTAKTKGLKNKAS